MLQRIALLLILLCTVFVMAGCTRAPFDQAADIALVEAALARQGLEICSQEPLAWTGTPGFVAGQHYRLAGDCTEDDPTNPGALLWVAAFQDVAARDAALRNVEHSRRLKSPTQTWSLGPLVMVMEGPHSPAAATALRQAQREIGAQ